MMFQVSKVLVAGFCFEPSVVHWVRPSNLIGQRVDMHLGVRSHWGYSTHLQKRVLLRNLLPLKTVVLSPCGLVLQIASSVRYDRLPYMMMTWRNLAKLGPRARHRHIIIVASVPWQAIGMILIHRGPLGLFMHVWREIMQRTRLQVSIRQSVNARIGVLLMQDIIILHVSQVLLFAWSRLQNLRGIWLVAFWRIRFE